MSHFATSILIGGVKLAPQVFKFFPAQFKNKITFSFHFFVASVTHVLRLHYLVCGAVVLSEKATREINSTIINNL